MNQIVFPDILYLIVFVSDLSESVLSLKYKCLGYA